MSVELNIQAHITGTTVEDAKAQLALLFGVALGQVVVTSDGRVEPANRQTTETSTTALATGSAPAEQTTGRGRGRPPKSESKPAETTAPAAEQPAKATPAAAPQDEEDDILGLLGVDGVDKVEQKPVTKDDLQAEAQKVIAKSGVAGLKNVLKAHGFTKIGEIPETAYGAVHADLVDAAAPAAA